MLYIVQIFISNRNKVFCVSINLMRTSVLIGPKVIPPFAAGFNSILGFEARRRKQQYRPSQRKTTLPYLHQLLVKTSFIE